MQCDTPRSPYVNSSLIELVDAAKRLGIALYETRTRTPDERRALVEDVRALLGMFAYRIEPRPHMIATPEHLLNGAPYRLAEVFVPWAESELVRAQHAARQHALLRAAQFVLGNECARWLHPPDVPSHKWPTALLYGGDEVLTEMIGRLQAILDNNGRCV